MNRKLIFVYTLDFAGGAETLLLRMCKWLKSNKLECEIWSYGQNNKELIEELRTNNVTITYFGWNDKKKIEKMIEKESENTIYIYFVFEDFMMMEWINGKIKGSSMNNILYVIHLNQLLKVRSVKSEFIKKKLKAYYKKIVVKLVDDNRVFFMDYSCVEKFMEYYEISDDMKQKVSIIPLPIIIDEGQKPDIEKIEYDILAASRTEFPFKGYLLGLVDDFRILKSKYPEIKMLIISDGPDKNDLKKKIENGSKDGISWIPFVPYEKYSEYVKKGKLFIGMGTSVLDAVNACRPALMVLPFSTECRAVDYFDSDPLEIASNTAEKDSIQMIENVMCMDDAAYAIWCVKSKETLKQYYDIDNIMPQIIRYCDGIKKENLSREELLLHHVVSAGRHKMKGMGIHI